MPYLLEGLKYTLIITIVGISLGCVIGTIFGLMRTSKNKIIYAIASIYIELVRGTPMLAQIFFLHFGLPQLLGLNLDKMLTANIIIAINSGAYIAEIVRGGIQSVDKGQMEAGRSLGFNSGQTMRYIIWPQALKLMIPPFGNQFVISLKDTSLLSAIAVGELMYQGRQVASSYVNYFDVYFIVCVMYLMITIPISLLLRRVERRLERS
ncbi:amino acid ABC transporter permease [Alkalicoccobacillus plakortidis]|uniref:Amino acid ABC transporter permease n=1 Tax=Alkalicoccobacillus plakortidis TaxID=444060 RepID=A0ABT0XF83_9BACI|nr:amino acid ABC transporter permease [Alkalicoccobacillus plakortidis]MCM2674553.1 amino acid ABC transporter permease [Alkalicoccobacillus plakortidis]